MDGKLTLVDELIKRGFVAQMTDETEVRRAFEDGRVTAYVGFDPSADSLHAGHLVPLMALAHLQRHGHRPITLLGGGTALIGDPSGKSAMRPMLTVQEVDANGQAIKKQVSRFLDFEGGKALILDNKEWLRPLHLLDFLRETGKHFSVARMLAAETYRSRLEAGLTFLEFNYMLLQSYDFYVLYRDYDCAMQMGGNDQWGNIVAGVELIRRKAQGKAEAITFPLLTTSSGAKMGKTESGALWLDGARTSPYEYYQYWVNVDDRDVVPFLLLYTFLPIEEIEAVRDLSGAELRAAKMILAYETTAIVHGEEGAREALEGAASAFGAREIGEALLPSSAIPRRVGEDGASVPTTVVTRGEVAEGLPLYVLLDRVGLTKSRGEAKRLIKQGGAYINGKRIGAMNQALQEGDFAQGDVTLKAGKKKVHRLALSD